MILTSTTLNGSSTATNQPLIYINTTGTVNLGTATTIGNNIFNLNDTNSNGSAYISAACRA